MDFKSFIIGLVVGIFGPYMDNLIRKKFLKSPKKNKDRSNYIKRFFIASLIYRGVSLILFRLLK